MEWIVGAPDIGQQRLSGKLRRSGRVTYSFKAVRRQAEEKLRPTPYESPTIRPLWRMRHFPCLARDTPFGRNCYIFAEGEFLQQRAQ